MLDFTKDQKAQLINWLLDMRDREDLYSDKWFIFHNKYLTLKFKK